MTKVSEQAGVSGICQIIAFFKKSNMTSQAPEEFDSFIKDSLARKGRHTNLNANQEAQTCKLSKLYPVAFACCASFFALLSRSHHSCSAAAQTLVSHLGRADPAVCHSLASISLAATSHESQRVTAPHARLRTHHDTIRAWISQPICDSASCRQELEQIWRSCQMSRCHMR